MEWIEIIRQGICNIGTSLYQAFFVEDRYFMYLKGVKTTLQISLLAVLIGVFIGILIATVKVSIANVRKKRFYHTILEGICNTYISIIRGTPVLLQLLIIYNLVLTSRGTSEIVIAAIAFGINSGAYVAEIVRAGICSIDRGQMEAGRSLGLNNIQTMRCIILPQAVKNILPALGNEFITLIKETSVASVIAVTDLTQVARAIGLRSYDILPPLFIAAFFYFAIVMLLSYGLKRIERRLAKSDSH